MARQPLHDRRVVVTRDEPGRLASRLAAAGADVVHVPLIEISAPADGGAALAAALGDVDAFDWVVVTSRHGAERVGPALSDAPGVRLAAVGSRTAEVLAAAAARAVDIVPPRHTAADLVAAMPDGAGRVLVAQADRADDVLAEGLRSRGYQVEVVTAYRTRLRHPSDREVQAAQQADAVTFASGSAVEAWVAAVGVEAPPVVAAIGPTTATVAERVGLKPTHIAADHDADGLADAVIEAFADGAG